MTVTLVMTLIGERGIERNRSGVGNVIFNVSFVDFCLRRGLVCYCNTIQSGNFVAMSLRKKIWHLLRHCSPVFSLFVDFSLSSIAEKFLQRTGIC